MIIETKEVEEDLVLSGYSLYAKLAPQQLNLHDISKASATNFVFYAKPTPADQIYSEGVELLAETLIAEKRESKYSYLTKNGNTTKISNAIGFMPQRLSISVLMHRGNRCMDLEFGDDFPTESLIDDNIVVPVNLLLHPSGAEELLVRVLSGTLVKHAQLSIYKLASLNKFELSLGSYKRSRWLDDETIKPYFDLERDK